MDSGEDDEDFVELLRLYGLQEYHAMYIDKRPYRDSCYTGSMFIWEVLHGHPDRCYDLFRMEKDVFIDLCNTMRDKSWLKNSRYVSVEEQVGIFLMTIGHNERNRMVAEKFQHSGETISRYFRKVLRAMNKFGKEIIMPPSFQSTAPEIRHNPKYYPWFKNCIGAIDGTHISASVPSKEQIPYRGRKSTVTQNVMCACSFDMRFTFVYAGWEGTAHDSRVFLEAITNERLKFPKPPQGKYYVVDSGYTNMPGFLTPYHGERYHLREYRGSGLRPTRKKELFNYVHSSLRNVIERCFGVLKARFPILKLMPPYSLRTQSLIVVAACAVHNFIRIKSQADKGFQMYDNDNLIVEDDSRNNRCAHSQPHVEPNREVATLRDQIANAMGAAYGFN